MRRKTKLRFLTLILSVLSSTVILGQSTVSGTVTDNSGKGISGASITAGGGRGTRLMGMENIH